MEGVNQHSVFVAYQSYLLAVDCRLLHNWCLLGADKETSGMAKLTKRLVDAAEATGPAVILWDDDVKGFGLRVSASGHKSYVFQYRLGGRGTPSRRITIGKHGSPWTPDAARKEALGLLMSVHSGNDPMAQRRTERTEMTTLAIETYVDAFIERYLKRYWARSWREGERALRQHVLPFWKGRVLKSITRRDVVQLMDRLADRPAVARLAYATLRKMFRWAVGRGDLETSPIADLPGPPPVVSRDRVLSDAELAAVWRAAETLGFPFGPIVQLLIATGARREEVAALRWSELNDDLWVLPGVRSKNALEHRVPLSPLALGVIATVPSLGADLLFSATGHTPPSGFSKAKKRLDLRLAADPEVVAGRLFSVPFRLHDLRRTVATGL